MNFGMIVGEPAETYHGTGAVSSHKLQDFARPNVPLLYQRKYLTKEIPSDPENPAFAFGEAFHCLALEGETVFASRFAVSPSFDRRTKQGKLDAEAFATANAGKKLIDSEDLHLCWQMIAAIRTKPATKALFDHGKPEVVFRHQLASFPIQSRIDWFDDRQDEWKRPLIIDLKSIDHLANFEKQFVNYNYYRQAAFYQLAVMETLQLPGAFPRFLFVVVEKEQPFQCAVFEPDEIALDIGRREVLADLARLKTCYDSGIWPGTPDEVQRIELPIWKQQQNIIP